MADATIPHGQTQQAKTKRPDSMQDCLPQFIRDLSKAETKHRERVGRYDTYDRIYRGEIDEPYRNRLAISSEDGDWRSDLHPMYAYETIQTELSMLLDDKPEASVKPPDGKPQDKPKAEAYESVVNEQRRRDNYDKKLVDYYSCGLIYGVGIGKVGWAYDHAKLRSQVLTPTYGNPLLSQRQIVDRDTTVLNQPTLTVCNPRDVMWNPEAATADEITTVFYRTYETKASLLAQQADGVYSNVDDVSSAMGGGAEQPGARDTRGSIEVMERWQIRADGVYLTAVANRSTVIRDEPSPVLLRGKSLPFVFAVPSPLPFRVEGMSEAHLLGELQYARWRVENQLIDNAELINNTTVFYDDRLQDPDGTFVIKPGGMNPMNAGGVPLTQAMLFWNPPTSIIQPALEMLKQLENDMETVTGVSSYLSGTPTETTDPKTATEVQNVAQGGQRRILMKKQRFAEAERLIGEFQLQLNEQLLPSMIPAYGPTGEPVPLRLQEIIGCKFEVEDASESLNRQERRQEASLVLQTVLAGAAIPQVAMAVNWRFLLENYFEANDIDPNLALASEQMQPAMGLPGAPQPGSGGLASAGPAPVAQLGQPTTPPVGAGQPSALPPIPFGGRAA
jgi:hypothetical protein